MWKLYCLNIENSVKFPETDPGLTDSALGATKTLMGLMPERDHSENNFYYFQRNTGIQ